MCFLHSKNHKQSHVDLEPDMVQPSQVRVVANDTLHLTAPTESLPHESHNQPALQARVMNAELLAAEKLERFNVLHRS